MRRMWPRLLAANVRATTVARRRARCPPLAEVADGRAPRSRSEGVPGAPPGRPLADTAVPAAHSREPRFAAHLDLLEARRTERLARALSGSYSARLRAASRRKVFFHPDLKSTYCFYAHTRMHEIMKLNRSKSAYRIHWE